MEEEDEEYKMTEKKQTEQDKVKELTEEHPGPVYNPMNPEGHRRFCMAYAPGITAETMKLENTFRNVNPDYIGIK